MGFARIPCLSSAQDFWRESTTERRVDEGHTTTLFLTQKMQEKSKLVVPQKEHVVGFARIPRLFQSAGLLAKVHYMRAVSMR